MTLSNWQCVGVRYVRTREDQESERKDEEEDKERRVRKAKVILTNFFF